MGDGVDARDIAVGDGQFHLQVHLPQALQQDDIETVIAAGALQVLAALLHQALELAGDDLDVVEEDAEVDEVVTDDRSEHEIELVIAQLQAQGPEFDGELALDGLQFPFMAADVGLALGNGRVIVGEGLLDQGFRGGGDPLAAVVGDILAGLGDLLLEGADALAVILGGGGGEEGDGLIEEFVDGGLVTGLILAEPAVLRQAGLALLQGEGFLQGRHHPRPQAGKAGLGTGAKIAPGGIPGLPGLLLGILPETLGPLLAPFEPASGAVPGTAPEVPGALPGLFPEGAVLGITGTIYLASRGFRSRGLRRVAGGHPRARCPRDRARLGGATPGRWQGQGHQQQGHECQGHPGIRVRDKVHEGSPVPRRRALPSGRRNRAERGRAGSA